MYSVLKNTPFPCRPLVLRLKAEQPWISNEYLQTKYNSLGDAGRGSIIDIDPGARTVEW